MDEKTRLLKALFQNPKERHLNIKFLRGFSEESTAEDMCREVNKAFNQVLLGLVKPTSSFDEQLSVVDVASLYVNCS
jgi:hypothetical protein